MKSNSTLSLGRRVATTLLCVASALATVDASAQARPAYTKNVDEPGRLPYEYAILISPTYGCFQPSDANCFNFQKFGNTLLFDGPVVPAGKRLIVQSISASLPTATPTGLIVGLQSMQYQLPFYMKWAFAGPFYPLLTASQYGMTATLFATYGPGERPHFFLYSPPTGGAVGEVSITGYLIDATN